MGRDSSAHFFMRRTHNPRSFHGKKLLIHKTKSGCFPISNCTFSIFAEIEKMLILLPLTHTSTRATTLSYKN